MTKLAQLQDNAPEHSTRKWNKGKLIGQKPPLKLKEVRAIRIRLELASSTRDLALFNLAVDSKLRSCGQVKPRVLDVSHGGNVSSRATVVQQKTKLPVKFEITEQTRRAVSGWINVSALSSWSRQKSGALWALSACSRTSDRHRSRCDGGVRA